MSAAQPRGSSRGPLRGRARVLVLQALVLALFATLLARLYYVQVVDGDGYHVAAADQSVRQIIDQPERGLIVDDEGRALVTNRKVWVISVDRQTLGLMKPADRHTLLRRLSGVVKQPVAAIRKTLRQWNGAAYQPVPVADDVSQATAGLVLEQPEDYPAVVADQQTVRSYPRPFDVNLAGVLGYDSSITRGEYKTARKNSDQSLNAASVVGRAGVEKEYDSWLRGMPGHTDVPVNAQGNPLGDDTTTTPAQAGDTLVTSIDARVQGVVEKQLALAIKTARATYDPVTHKNYIADSGAAIVMDAHNGRIVAMASQPTYDPSEWVGGISQTNLDKLYAKSSGDPLLFRATQGQFAPGSTWKPVMTAGALSNGMSENTLLDCSSSLQVGNRVFKNYESESYGMIGFAKALQVSCDTFFYRVGLHFWNEYGSDPTDVNAKDPLVAEAKAFGFGKPTGIDIPGEASGRVADRHWKLRYYKAMKGYYCSMDQKQNAPSAYMQLFAHEFCLEGNYYRAGDAVNFAIGQGDTLVTPLQLTRAYAALANGGTLYEPRIGKAIVSADGTVIKKIKPKVAGYVPASKATMSYIDNALLGTPETGTLAWKFEGFPLDKVKIRGKTGSAEVYNKQSTSWVATYNKDYVVLMMVSQGGTGSGTSGPGVRAIWQALYGINGETVNESKSAIPGVTPPTRLPTFTKDGSILPPSRGKRGRQ
jgi:penicillin-binding protein 2